MHLPNPRLLNRGPSAHLEGRSTLTRGPRAQVLLMVINRCEAWFSDLLTIETKCRNRLDARNDNRLADSGTETNIKGLLK